MEPPAHSSSPWDVHRSVLAKEVIASFDLGRPAVVVDGTLGMGGHTEGLLDAYPEMRVIGLDWDEQALAIAGQRLSRFGDRFQSHPLNYSDLREFLSEHKIDGVDGVLLDLGLSSLQLEDGVRGFSFKKSGPLDMRMSSATRETAWDLLSSSTADDLAAIFRTYGEEPRAWPIAQALYRAIEEGTLDNDAWKVAEVVRRAAGYAHSRTDSATKVFQALRIAVNRELDNLDHFLTELPALLRSAGRAAVISFHSLEDRRVKTAFVAAAKGCVCPPRIPQCVCGIQPWGRLVTRKAIQASESEVSSNPRSRSARLRVLEKL